MIPHYSIYLGNGQLPTLTFREGGKITHAVFQEHGYEISYSSLVCEPPQQAIIPCGEISDNSEISLGKLKALDNLERLVTLSNLATKGFFNIFSELEGMVNKASECHRARFDQEPVAAVTMWRTHPTILCADDPGCPHGPSFGYSVFANLAVAVVGSLPEELTGKSPVPLPTYVAPIVDSSAYDLARSGIGRMQLAAGYLRGVKLRRS